LTESNYRKNGFLDFINSKSSMNLQWVFNGDYSTESGRHAFHDFMKSGDNKKIAIFSCSDGMSLGFLTEAHKANVNVLEKIKIAGYDNMPMCENLHPALTSISTNFQDIGEQAIVYLNQKFANGHANGHDIGHDDFFKGHLYLVPVHLVERLSTRK
jgi:DNA-binding LacI/PurR family transcriptional regulator